LNNIAGLVIVLVAASGARAATQDRPPLRQPLQELVRTEVVYPQEHGEVQFTLRTLFDRGRSSDSIGMPISVEYGLTDAWQVEVEWLAFSRIHSDGGAASALGGLALGTKYSFMNIRGSGVHAALGVEAGWARELEPEGTLDTNAEIEPFGVVAVDLFEARAQVFAHLGVSILRRESLVVDDDDLGGSELTWNTGAFVPGRYLTLALELNGRTHARDLYATPSVTFLLPRPWELGVGVPIGLQHRSMRMGLSVQLIYEK
jgi:hypothetical protein